MNSPSTKLILTLYRSLLKKARTYDKTVPRKLNPILLLNPGPLEADSLYSYVRDYFKNNAVSPRVTIFIYLFIFFLIFFCFE